MAKKLKLLPTQIRLSRPTRMVFLGSYLSRVSNFSLPSGTFDIDLSVWFRWRGADLRTDQSFGFVNGVITSRSENDVITDRGFNRTQARVQATIFQIWLYCRRLYVRSLYAITHQLSSTRSLNISLFSKTASLVLSLNLDAQLWHKLTHPHLLCTDNVRSYEDSVTNCQQGTCHARHKKCRQSQIFPLLPNAYEN